MLPFWLQRLDDSLPLAATGLSRTLTENLPEHVYVTPSYANTAALPVYLRVNWVLTGSCSPSVIPIRPGRCKTFIDSLPVSQRLKKRPSRFAMQNVYWASRFSSPFLDD